MTRVACSGRQYPRCSMSARDVAAHDAVVAARDSHFGGRHMMVEVDAYGQGTKEREKRARVRVRKGAVLGDWGEDASNGERAISRQ
mmetsp:Transcript_81369/g.161824  ORF Transcript_81369/g.161824 Transcript_81369/m.161824 type:complete len:86 (-) Transcript_81369:840-1097(-)